MPIRIKPTHDLRPCVLTLESLRKIVELVDEDFPTAAYSANDNVWEIYEEPKQSFLAAVSQRDTLDSFMVKAQTGVPGNERELQIVFDEDKATVSCMARPEHEHWFRHFLIDLKECILSPSFMQLVVHRYGQGRLYLRLPLLFVPFDISMAVSTPYCKIVIHRKPPNPFVENIKANLVSNIIWAVIVFLLGVITTLVTQGIIGR